MLENLANVGLSDTELAEHAAKVYACAEELTGEGTPDATSMWVPQHWSDGEDDDGDVLQAAFNATPDHEAVCSILDAAPNSAAAARHPAPNGVQ